MAAPFSAFRSVPSRTTNEERERLGLVPIDTMLIPEEFVTAFSIPVVSFDQCEAPVTGAILQPPFELPLAFSVRVIAHFSECSCNNFLKL